MRNLLAKLFGRTYRIKLINSAATVYHVSYYRGRAWGAVLHGYELAAEKGDDWTISEITSV